MAGMVGRQLTPRELGYDENGVWLGYCPSSLVWPDSCCVSLNV